MGERTTGTRIIERKGEAPKLLVRDATLRVLEGAQADTSVPVGLVSVCVGSGDEAELVLTDSAVSHAHVSLRMMEQGCEIRDLGSKNGTFIDGIRVLVVIVSRSVELTVGATKLKLELGDTDATLALTRATSFGSMLGHGPQMRSVFAVLEQAAKTDATMLVLGESGTGKELAARAIHDRSTRKEGPFVVFDCAAVAPTLLESQLFGHVRGAFTGATDARAGVFEEGHGGTVVLDEIGELPLELQPKLLRVLEERTVQRVGESKRKQVDVRFVACTHRNLAEEVRAGRFRQDLFYRLSVISVRLPPLRERADEIPRLVGHFLQRFAGDSAPDVPESVLAMLCAYTWPGNVRELRNFVERFLALPGLSPALLLGVEPGALETSTQQGSALPATAAWDASFHDAKGRITDWFEREYLVRLLAKHGDNLSEAARVSGLSRQSCYRLMHKHGLGGSDT
jgi:transcriptional regulator with PAS, ATPase and Fis domain